MTWPKMTDNSIKKNINVSVRTIDLTSIGTWDELQYKLPLDFFLL